MKFISSFHGTARLAAVGFIVGSDPTPAPLSSGGERSGKRKMNTPGMANKDRQGRRIVLSSRVVFCSQHEIQGEGTLLDISTSGCQISSMVAVSPGLLFSFFVFLSDHPWPLQIEEAVVRWVTGQEFGLEFTQIRIAQRERLRALIMQARL